VGILLWSVPDVTAVPAAKIVEVRELGQGVKQNGVGRVARRALPSDHMYWLFGRSSSWVSQIGQKTSLSSELAAHLFSILYVRNGRSIAAGNHRGEASALRRSTTLYRSACRLRV
jgi:hypothetical protein